MKEMYNPETWQEAIDEIYRIKGIVITQQEHLDKTQTPQQIDREILRLLRIVNGMMGFAIITWMVWGIKTILGWIF